MASAGSIQMHVFATGNEIKEENQINKKEPNKQELLEKIKKAKGEKLVKLVHDGLAENIISSQELENIQNSSSVLLLNNSDNKTSFLQSLFDGIPVGKRTVRDRKALKERAQEFMQDNNYKSITIVRQTERNEPEVFTFYNQRPPRAYFKMFGKKMNFNLKCLFKIPSANVSEKHTLTDFDDCLPSCNDSSDEGLLEANSQEIMEWLKKCKPETTGVVAVDSNPSIDLEQSATEVGVVEEQKALSSEESTIPNIGFEQCLEILKKLENCTTQDDCKKILSTEKINANARINGTQTTLLHVASCNDYVNAVKLLTAAKANVNAKNEEGDTPLHLACSEDDVAVFNALKDAGADLKAEDKLGRTPLKIASQMGHTKIFEALIAAQQNANKNTNNETPAYQPMNPFQQPES